MAFPHCSKEYNSLGLTDLAQRVPVTQFIGFNARPSAAAQTGFAVPAAVPNGLVAPKPFSLARKPLDMAFAPTQANSVFHATLAGAHPQVDDMDHSGVDQAAALVTPTNVLQGQIIAPAVQRFPDTFDLFTEAHHVLIHYLTFLLLAMFHGNPPFFRDPRVRAFMTQAEKAMIVPAPVGPGGEHRIKLRQDAVQIVAEVFQKLPFHDFL
jgi:hypothetical protein